MEKAEKSRVIIETAAPDLRQTVEGLMTALGPRSFSGARVLVKPNMVGPSAPELGHTTHPELVRAVVLACLDRGAKVWVGDNPGGINRNSRTVAEVTGILQASEGCYVPLSERVVERQGAETGIPLVVSRAVLEADYVINLPIFKTHSMTMISGALKNLYGYVAGACKARIHLLASKKETFAKAVCDIHGLRPPDLHILDAITAIEGNGPCHGGQLRNVGKLLASRDPLALDAVMARMMSVDPSDLPVQKEALARRLGALDPADIEIQGELVPIPDFKIPVTYGPRRPGDEGLAELRRLYPKDMMSDRVSIRPQRDETKCTLCGDCALNCPAEVIELEPEFRIGDGCIACFCCVELCNEGAMEVPDVAAFRYY